MTGAAVDDRCRAGGAVIPTLRILSTLLLAAMAAGHGCRSGQR